MKECIDALNHLIEVITLEPVLYQTQLEDQFELEDNGLTFAVSAILFQRDKEGRRRPVSYHLSSLTATERNYDIWD